MLSIAIRVICCIVLLLSVACDSPNGQTTRQTSADKPVKKRRAKPGKPQGGMTREMHEALNMMLPPHHTQPPEVKVKYLAKKCGQLKCTKELTSAKAPASEAAEACIMECIPEDMREKRARYNAEDEAKAAKAAPAAQ